MKEIHCADDRPGILHRRRGCHHDHCCRSRVFTTVQRSYFFLRRCCHYPTRGGQDHATSSTFSTSAKSSSTSETSSVNVNTSFWPPLRVANKLLTISSLVSLFETMSTLNFILSRSKSILHQMSMSFFVDNHGTSSLYIGNWFQLQNTRSHSAKITNHLSLEEIGALYLLSFV